MLEGWGEVGILWVLELDAWPWRTACRRQCAQSLFRSLFPSASASQQTGTLKRKIFFCSNTFGIFWYQHDWFRTCSSVRGRLWEVLPLSVRKPASVDEWNNFSSSFELQRFAFDGDVASGGGVVARHEDPPGVRHGRRGPARNEQGSGQRDAHST